MLKSKEILPEEFRLRKQIQDGIGEQEFSPIHPTYWYNLMLKYHKALKAAELEAEK